MDWSSTIFVCRCSWPCYVSLLSQYNQNFFVAMNVHVHAMRCFSFDALSPNQLDTFQPRNTTLFD